MAKNETTTPTRYDGLKYDPNDLTIYGLDTEENNPTHALYDKRIHLPLDRSMIDTMKELGVISPVTTVKDPKSGRVYVIDGRQRVRHLRAANAELAAEGKPTLTVKCNTTKADEKTQAVINIVANEHRTEDDTLTKARKAERMTDIGHSDEAVMSMFRVGKQTIDNWRRMLSCHPDVIQAVEDRKIAPSAAYKLGLLTHEEQVAALPGIVGAPTTEAPEAPEARPEHRPQTPKRGTAARAGRVITATRRSNATTAEERTTTYDPIHAKIRSTILKNAKDLPDLDSDFVRFLRVLAGELSPSTVKGLTKVLAQINGKGEG